MSFSARTSNLNKHFKQMELRILWIPKFSKQIMIRHEVDFAHPQPIADGVPQVVIHSNLKIHRTMGHHILIYSIYIYYNIIIYIYIRIYIYVYIYILYIYITSI